MLMRRRSIINAIGDEEPLLRSRQPVEFLRNDVHSLARGLLVRRARPLMSGAARPGHGARAARVCVTSVGGWGVCVSDGDDWVVVCRQRLQRISNRRRHE